MFLNNDGRDALIEKSLKYLEKVVEDVQGLHAPSAAHGVRFGFAIAMRHPEYAQAFLKMTDIPILRARGSEERCVNDFVRRVPIEGVSDVLPTS